MTSQAWTPQDIAQYDQDVAAADQELDTVLAILRQQAAEHGEPQALANMSLALRMDDNRLRDRGLLLTALRRLMGEPE